MDRHHIEKVLNSRPDLLIVPNGEKFEARRRSFLVPIIDSLPGGRSKWGILKKTGGVPSDVITDLESSTHEHIDVMSGENVTEGISRITAAWKSQGDYRRHSPHWKRETLDKALREGWIDPLPGSVEPEPDEPSEPEERGVEERLTAAEKDIEYITRYLRGI
jgi:hypothetical protein